MKKEPNAPSEIKEATMDPAAFNLLIQLLQGGVSTGTIKFNGSLLVETGGKSVEVHAVGTEVVVDEEHVPSSTITVGIDPRHNIVWATHLAEQAEDEEITTG